MKALVKYGIWSPALLLGITIGACTRSHASPAPTTVRPPTPPPTRTAPLPMVLRVVDLAHARAEEVAFTLKYLYRGRAPLFEAPVWINAYHHRNALVLAGTPKDIAKLRKLVRKLDLPRRTYLRLQKRATPRKRSVSTADASPSRLPR